jgi:hypothetical protein
VRVGSVPQRHSLVRYTSSGLGILSGIGTSVHLPEVIRDGLIVSLCALERLDGQTPLGLVRNLAALLPFLENDVVVGRRRDDGDTGVVLGGGSEEGDTTDIDLLNSGSEGAIGLGGLHDEWVEVANHQSDRGDLVGSQVCKVGFDLSGKDT